MNHDCSENCLHGSYYKITENFDKKELIVNFDDIKTEYGIYECFEDCECSQICTNRLVQFGPRKNLKIVSFPDKGLGLVTETFIPKGSFICEYAGEILTKSEAIKRNQENDAAGLMNYILCLNEIVEGKTKFQTFVDPSRKANIGRYLNHSCEPNCCIVPVRVGTISCQIGELFFLSRISQIIISPSDTLNWVSNQNLISDSSETNFP
jgi:histone-lysine N-methyltransferase SETMAR